jgi:hypothetical protein
MRIYFRLKCGMERQGKKNNSTGRNKRNIPLPVFQNEPKGKIIDFTYKERGIATHESC